MSGWLRRTARWAQEGGLYLLFLLLPFSKASVEISFAVMLSGWAIARLDPATRRESLWWRPELRPLALALAAFLAACALSIAVSGHPALSLRGFVGKWLEYILMLVIVADCAARPAVQQRCLALLVASSSLVAVEGIVQQLFHIELFQRATIMKIMAEHNQMVGPYENPSDLATYLMVVVPLVLAFGVTRRGWARAAGWGVGLVLIGCLAWTQTIGAWLALCAGWLAVISQRKAKRVLLLVIFGVIACSGALALGHSDRFLTSFTLSAGTGNSDRLVMWQAALGMIKDRPVLGHGVNTFMANYLTYWVGGERMPRYAHNCYLQVAAETGLVGLAAFLAVLWLLFSRLQGGLRRAAGEEDLLLAGLFIALLAFVLQAGVDTNFYSLRHAALFWALAGFALRVSEAPAAEPAPLSQAVPSGTRTMPRPRAPRRELVG